MQIIRDEDQDGMSTPCISMVPLLVSWGVKRCNIRQCNENPTTIITQTKAGVFGMCEAHFQEAKATEGDYHLKLEFD